MPVNDATLRELHAELDAHLRRIERLLPSDYRLTLVARHATRPKAGIVMTRDDPEQAILTIRQVMAESDAGKASVFDPAKIQRRPSGGPTDGTPKRV